MRYYSIGTFVPKDKKKKNGIPSSIKFNLSKSHFAAPNVLFNK